MWISPKRQSSREYLSGFLPRTIAYGEQLLPIPWRAQCWSWLGCYEEALRIYRDAGQPIEQVDLRLLAACGMTTDLRLRAEALKTDDEKRKAAASIMAFAPDLACELFSQIETSVLHAAALSTLERFTEAREILKASKRQTNSNDNLLLLEANCGLLAPLRALNRCLYNADLQTLDIDEQHPQAAFSFRAKTIKHVKEGPKVTIIMAAYNTELYAEKSITSLLNQTWQNIEVIAVDDASKDNTLSILKRISEQDSRLKIIQQRDNQGPYAARMRAIKIATGKFITCHDSDDWAHPQRVERQVKPLLENQKLIATTSNWVRMTASNKFYARRSWPLIHHNPASPMFRKDIVLNTIGGFDVVRAGADSEFYQRLKVAFGVNRIKQVSGILALGAHRSDSITNSIETGIINFEPSHSRRAYWESWRHWHINCIRRGVIPKMPNTGPRPFTAPIDILSKL